MKKITAVLLMFCLLFSPCFAEELKDDFNYDELSVPTLEPGMGVSVTAPSAVLMHSSGKVLFEKDAHTPRRPASVTKVMTLLLTFEAIERGDVALTDVITASQHAASMGGSQIWLEVGETFTLDEMIKAIAVASANDCSVAVAEHIAGTEEAFVALMNQRAKELGMENTVFKNCCGLDVEGHVTTAYDIALMSIELLKHEKVTEYTTIWEDHLRGGASVLNNTNKLLRHYEGMNGLKTGSTSLAGFCLSASAVRENFSLVAVVMGASTSKERSQDIVSLLNYGFANFRAVKMSSDTPILPVPVILGRQKTVKCDLSSGQELVISKNELSGIQKEIVMDENVHAPVALGQQVGELKILSNGQVIKSVPIVALEAVERMTLWDIFVSFLKCVGMREN